VLGPYHRGQLTRIRLALASGEVENIPQDNYASPDDTTKYHSVAIRRDIYGEPDRVGLELRAITRNTPDAKRVLRATVRFLSDPKRARVKLGTRGRSYRVSELREVDRLDDDTSSRFPEDVREFFDRWRGATSYAWTRERIQRWSLPLVRFEERSYISPEVGARVGEARQAFLEEAKAAAQIEDADEAASRMDEAVHHFAETTQLHQYY
jgi:hypothetical protein